MTFGTLRSALLIGAAWAITGAAAAAAAQDQQPPAQPDAAANSAPAPSDASDQAQLSDIVVTAERREENLQRVPISVGVLTGNNLRDFQQGGEDTLLSLSGRVPGLYAETTTGRIFPRFYIRGLGNIDFYLGASQPVEIIQDDVILEHVVLKSNPAFDIRQVEVLRGPQGSLFGRNTTAGIIKFDSYQPTQDFEGRGSLSGGSYGTVNLDAGVGGPIVKDVLAFRLSTLIQHRMDYVNNVYSGPSADGTFTPNKNAMGGYDDRNVRLQLLFTPTDRLTIEGSGHARWYDGTSTLFHRAGLVKGSNNVDDVPWKTVAYDEAHDNPQAYKTQGASAHVAYDFGGATLTSITAYEHSAGYSRGDTDGGAAADFPFRGAANGFGQSQGRLRDLDQWSEEVRLASNPGGRFDWQLGGLYFDSRDMTEFDQRAFFLTTAARNPNNWVLLHDINTSYSGFGQVTWHATDKLTITAGGRVTEDKKHTILLKTANTQANVSTYKGRTNVELSDTQPSADASVLYQINPDVSVYVRYAHGFRGPTIQGRSAVFNADFTTANSEKIDSIEAGFKSNLFGDTLRLNATGFAYRVHDIQLNGNDSNGNGVLFNANRADAYGLEASADWKPVPRLTLGAGLSLLHSEIKDKNVFAQTCSLNGVQTCTVLSPFFTRGNTNPVGTAPSTGTTYFASVDGNPLPNAPEYNVDLTARYDQPLGDGSKVFVAGDFNIQGYTQFVLYKTKEFYANGNNALGMQVGYVAPDGSWQIAAFARNLTKQKNLIGVIENYNAAVLNEPRVFGVTLSGQFR